MPLFAEAFIKSSRDYETHVARMIMDCERSAKSHHLYRHIVDALVKHGQLPLYKAIQLLIKHHTDSEYAQETIMSMIAETGPDLIRLLDYLVKVHSKRSIPNNVLDKVLAHCVTYQDPQLPMFCLNNLINKKPEQIRQLSSSNVSSFLQLQQSLSEENASRESKLEALVQKVQKMCFVKDRAL
jgi:hypothetical protein